MFDKNTIIDAITQVSELYSIPISEIVVIMGAALVLHEIKTTTDDIDISCSSLVFDQLTEKGFNISESKSGLRKVIIDSISFYENWEVADIEIVSGLQIASISCIAKDKKRLCREKDLEDLFLISSSFHENNNILNYSIFSYPNVLRGSLHQGENDEIVLILSGYFSANRIGYNSMFFKMANAINSAGYSVLRVDLSAMGESDGDYSQLEFNHHIADLYCIIKDILRRGYGKIHLIGHCEGCFEAIAISSYFDCVKSLMLIAPPINDDDVLKHLLENEGIKELKEKGYVDRKGLRCHKSFFDLTKTRLMEYCSRDSVPKNVIVYLAEQDEFVNNTLVTDWAKENNYSCIVFESANHNFTNINAQGRLFKSIIDDLNNGEYEL